MRQKRQANLVNKLLLALHSFPRLASLEVAQDSALEVPPGQQTLVATTVSREKINKGMQLLSMWLPLPFWCCNHKSREIHGAPDGAMNCPGPGSGAQSGQCVRAQVQWQLLVSVKYGVQIQPSPPTPQKGECRFA